MFGIEMVLAYFIIALIGSLLMRTYARAGLLNEGIIRKDFLARKYGLDDNLNSVVRVVADVFVVGCGVGLFFFGSPFLLYGAVISYAVTNTVCHFYLRRKLPVVTAEAPSV